MTIMDSYLAAPNIHASSVEPKPPWRAFMDIPESRVEEVQALYQQTQEQQAPLIRFAKAVKELDKLLATEEGLRTGNAV